MVTACVTQIKSSIINDIIEKYVTEPKIKNQSDKIIVNVTKKDTKETYTFLNDYKEIKVAGEMNNNQKFDATLTAKEINSILVIDYMEFIMTQMKTKLYYSYGNENGNLRLSELKMKSEMPGMNLEYTFVFSKWMIK